MAQVGKISNRKTIVRRINRRKIRASLKRHCK